MEWLRAPTRNANNQNMGAKCLRNRTDGGKVWEKTRVKSKSETTVRGRDKVDARFMEIDEKLAEIDGDAGGISVV